MNIFNIPSNYNFLKSLVQFVQEKFTDNILLSNLTILLPSRRSCNELKRIFLEQKENNAIILPNIRAIGDIDYDDIVLQNLSFDYLQKFQEIVKPVSQIKYKIFLIKQILKWSKQQNLDNEFHNISTEQACMLASELDKFLNETKKEGLSLENLKNIMEEEYAEHWLKILDFLKRFGRKWDKFLDEQNIISLYDYRIKMIELNTEFFKNNKPEYPIIVAGSSGSVKATTEFIKTILQHDNCFVFLKGLDKRMTDEEWKNIDSFHPQIKFKNLLEKIKINRFDIPDFFDKNFILSQSEIEKILSLSLLPSNLTNQWQNKIEIDKNIIKNISKIECRDSHEELNVVSIILRNCIEEKDKSIALITTSKDFAKQVELKLNKWNVEVNNTFGIKLLNTRVFNYLCLLLNATIENFNPLSLLSLLKHPFTLAGYDENEFQKYITLFEDFVLRGQNNNNGFQSFFENLEKIPIKEISKEENKYEIKIDKKTKKLLFDFIKNLQQKLSKLSQTANQPIPLKEIINLHLKTAEDLASNSVANGKDVLWGDDRGGEELYKFFEDLIQEADNYKEINLEDYLALLRYFLTKHSFTKKYQIHPAVNIISPIEARLIDYDLFIISNLNEGQFPIHITTDPWMSKAMRKDFGLSSKEEIIGMYAYDFVQYLSQKEVILTRSMKEDGVPTSKSRFLLRLETFLKCQNVEIRENNIWKEASKLYNQPTEIIKINRPEPRPSAKLRPKKLSATRIENLIKNPYEIYAKKILNLYVKEGINEEKTFMVFGNAVHKTLEEFVSKYNEIKGDKLEKFLEIGSRIFDEYFADEISRELWKPRLINIAKWFVFNEQKTRDKNCKIYTEKYGKARVGDLDFWVEAQADRVQIDPQGNVSIIDYKTGTAPSKSDVQKGLAPQLSIEALILKNKGFIDVKTRITNINSLEYWEIKGKNDQPKTIKITQENNNYDINQLIQTTEQGLIQLILYFMDETNPYIAAAEIGSKFNKKGQDYKHLSRVEEWL